MKKFLVFLLLSCVAFASTYYAKLEPVEKFTIKSDVSGKVIFSDLAKEGSYVKDAVIIQVDDDLNRKNLHSVNAKIESLRKIVSISKENLKNLEEVEKIKKKRYEKYLELSTKSAFDKENELINYITTQNQTLSLKQSIENNMIQIDDLLYQKATLEDTIAKKRVQVKNLYIYSIAVKKDDFISLGAPLLEAHDISSGKLTIFVTQEDLDNLANLKFYIDGVLQENPKYQIWSVADTQNISAYRCEIEISAPKYFSKLVKVELK